MYLHIGGNTIVRTRDIVGIFDLDSTTISTVTRTFLRRCESDGASSGGISFSATEDLPHSFVLTAENPQTFQVQYAHLSARTLAGRTRRPFSEENGTASAKAYKKITGIHSKKPRTPERTTTHAT